MPRRTKYLIVLAILFLPLLSACVPASEGFSTVPSDDWFFRLGRCEQPGSGYQGVQWDSYGNYPGGLGFLPATWNLVKDEDWPAVMSDASWVQQVIAGRRLYMMYGTSPWGCSATIGAP